MLNITVKELAEKLNNLLVNNRNIDMGARIVDAYVVNSHDREYPPGTILFECVSLDTNEPTHVLSIYPTRINKTLQ